MPKNVQSIALISHASKVMLKILQARLQRNVNCELTDVQAGFRKGRGTEIKLPTSEEKAMATHSSILDLRIPLAEVPDGL